MKILLASESDGEILSIVADYLSEVLHVPAIKLSGSRSAPEFSAAVDAAIEMFSLRQEVEALENLYQVVLVGGSSLWSDVAKARLLLSEGTTAQRLSMAHNVIVMEQLLPHDLAYWDMIFFRPVTGSLSSQDLGSLCGQYRGLDGSLIDVPENEDEATDQIVEEIASYLGIDEDEN